MKTLKKIGKYIAGIFVLIGSIIGGMFMLNLRKNKNALLKKRIDERQRKNEELIEETDEWLDNNPPLDRID